MDIGNRAAAFLKLQVCVFHCLCKVLEDMLETQIAPIGGHDKSSGERVEVGAGPRLPHPKVEQARQHGNALAQQLAQAGLHGLDFNARPQQRQMVTYDDL